MNWYTGNIAEAVALSKEKNAVFVVYVEGKDDLSKKMTNFINDEKIKGKLEGDEFVCIKIEGGSTSYMQFAQIYQLVPLPSLFFIGKNGTPLEIATGIISSVEELNGKIENALKLAGFPSKSIETENLHQTNSNEALSSPQQSSSSLETISISHEASTSASFISHEKEVVCKDSTDVNKPPDVVCDGDVCYKKPTTTESKEFYEKSETEEAEKSHVSKNAESIELEQTEKTTVDNKITDTKPSTSNSDNQEKEDEIQIKLQHTKNLLDTQKKEREQEEGKLECEREIQRRKEGQRMQNLKKSQEDKELQLIKEKIKKDKLEEQTARQRILEQIAADRAERAAQKINSSAPSSGNQGDKSLPKPSTSQKSKGINNGEFVRVQFKKPNGESETHNFLPTDQFKVIREFVKNTLLDGKVKEFSLATNIPRRDFTAEHDTQTLKELDLYPSVVLLILFPTITSGPAAVVARSGGFVNIFNTVFWGMLSPIFYVFKYIKNLISGPSSNNSGAQKRSNEDRITANDASKRRNIDRFRNNEIIDDGPSTSGNTTGTTNTKPYKRIGNSNVHRLQDRKDSDDENNTWNGNSTQQQ